VIFKALQRIKCLKYTINKHILLVPFMYSTLGRRSLHLLPLRPSGLASSPTVQLLFFPSISTICTAFKIHLFLSLVFDPAQFALLTGRLCFQSLPCTWKGGRGDPDIPYHTIPYHTMPYYTIYQKNQSIVDSNQVS